MAVGWIGVAYRPTSSAPTESKKITHFSDLGWCWNFLMSSRKKLIFFIKMALKFFLRTFRHQWRYLTCSLDHKLQNNTNYMGVGCIGVAYRPISPAPTESKKSLIFRICGFVGIFSCLRQKSEFFHQNGSKIFSTHFQTPMKVSNMFLRS